MDFAETLKLLIPVLREIGTRFAIVGGHALGAYGMARATLDLDLVVDGSAQEGILGAMVDLGYETLYASAGYSNHLHPDSRRGRVDFVYVRGTTADTLFSEARRMAGPGGIELLVPRPEHLAAMKVRAMKDDPSRRLRELVDIEFLLGLPGVDRALVEGYFRRHGLEDELDELP